MISLSYNKVKLRIDVLTILSLLLLSIISNYWLLVKIFSGRIYLFGSLPIHEPYPFESWSVWNTKLGMQRNLLPLSSFLSYIDLLPPNVAWSIDRIIIPIIGGLSVYLLIKALSRRLTESDDSFNNRASLSVGLSAVIASIIYELILLSRYTDFWIRGFLAIIPMVPLFSLITFKEIKNNNWKKAYVFALLTIMFLCALYDWRLHLSGAVLAMIFVLGTIPLSSVLEITRNKKFWIIFSSSFLVWCILWMIPHLYSVYLYSLSHTRSVTLAVIVGDYSLPSVFGLYSPDIILRLLYFSLIVIAFSSLLMSKKIPFYKFVLMASTVLIFLTLITWNHSPLKFIQYFLVSLSLGKFDIGSLFRTHKVFTGITLPLTITIFGLSVNWACSKLTKKQKATLCLLLILFVGLVSWRVAEINNRENRVTVIPDEYFEVADWLRNHQDSYRTLWLPRTGKYRPIECPVWLKTEGWGAPETSLGLRTYYYYGKSMEYLYPFLMRLLEENKTRSVAYILSYLGVKYVALHDDYWWGRLLEWIATARKNLDASPYFELRFCTEHILIYENLLVKYPVHVATTPILIDGGLRTLASLIEKSDIDFSKCSFFFTDLPIPKEVIYSAPIVVTDSVNDLRFNLLTNLLISEGEEGYILVPSCFTKGIEKGKWHPLFVDNPHHAEWEVFYVWQYRNASFENSFKFSWGFVGSRIKEERLKIPLNFKGKGNYVVLVRYLENEKGGSIEIRVDGKYIRIPTKGSGNRFRWFVANFTIENNNTIIIRNIEGRNAINIVLPLPYEKFSFLSKEVEEILNSKKIILLKDLKKYDVAVFNTMNNDTITIQSIKHKNGIYVLDILTETQEVSIGITIPEQYHGGWAALIDGNQKFISTPHMFVNNFWVTLQNKGYHKIIIEFTPQKTWAVIYLINGCITFFILVFSPLYLFYNRRKKALSKLKELKHNIQTTLKD